MLRAAVIPNWKQMVTGLQFSIFRIIVILAGILYCNTTLGDKLRGHYDSRAQLTTKLANGKNEMDMLIMKSKLPSVGDCWKEALDDLRASCSELDDEMQSRLALSFTACFIDMTGGSNHICERTTPIKSCLITLDKLEMDTFRDYFLHTQDMCYYIQSQIWHEETDRAVNDLHYAAVEMERTVQEQKKVADSILESQHNAHTVQKEILRENYDMFEKVTHIKNSIEDFGVEARENRMIFMEIFEKLRKMQDLVIWIQGEMSLIDLASFYIGGVLISYFLTVSERSHGARLWMILILVVGLCGERFLYQYNSEKGNISPEEIIVWIQYYRRVVGGLAGAVLLLHLARYRDLQVINNSLLTDMAARMDNFMLSMKDEIKSIQNTALPARFQQILNSPQMNAAVVNALLNGAVPDPAPIAVHAAASQTDDESEELNAEGSTDEEENQSPVGDHDTDGTTDTFDSDEDGDTDNVEMQRIPGSIFHPEIHIPFFTLQEAKTMCKSSHSNPPKVTAESPSDDEDEENHDTDKVPMGDDRRSVEPKYNLRERKPNQTPNSRAASVEPQSGIKKKRSGGKKPKGGYYSSDDDI